MSPANFPGVAGGPAAIVNVRACNGCGSPLSRYNPANVCQSCMSATGEAQAINPRDVSVNGTAIAELRHQRGLTRKLLADRAGVSFSIVKKLERNSRRSARIGTLNAIASVLQVPLGELLDVERNDA